MRGKERPDRLRISGFSYICTSPTGLTQGSLTLAQYLKIVVPRRAPGLGIYRGLPQARRKSSYCTWHLGEGCTVQSRVSPSVHRSANGTLVSPKTVFFIVFGLLLEVLRRSEAPVNWTPYPTIGPFTHAAKTGVSRKKGRENITAVGRFFVCLFVFFLVTSYPGTIISWYCVLIWPYIN